MGFMFLKYILRWIIEFVGYIKNLKEDCNIKLIFLEDLLFLKVFFFLDCICLFDGLKSFLNELLFSN